jgi:hypothetical protein
VLLESIRQSVPDASDPHALTVLGYWKEALGGQARLSQLAAVRYHIERKEGKFEDQLVLTVAPAGKVHRHQIETLRHKTLERFRAVEGNNGWEYDISVPNPFPDVLGENRARDFALEYFPFMLPGWFSQELKYTYKGPPSPKSLDVVVLTAHRPTGETIDISFSTQHYLPLSFSWRELYRGAIVHRDHFITKYQNIDGLWLPAAVEVHVTEKPFGTYIITDADVNPQLPPNFFQMPEVYQTTLRGAPKAGTAEAEATGTQAPVVEGD